MGSNIKNLRVQAGHSSNVESLTVISSSLYEFIEKSNVFVLYFTIHFHELNSLDGSESVEHHMVMGREESSGLADIEQMGQHCRGYGKPVKGRGASAQFVHNDQRVAGGLLDKRLGLLHFDEEGALVLHDAVRSPNSREDAVHRGQGAVRCRHKAANLGHDYAYADRSENSRFSSHIRSSY